jgi:hypothetical protein
MKKCIICGKQYFSKGYCRRHYNHIFVYGKVLQRTRSDPNEISEKDTFYEMALYNRTHKITGYTKFDKGDLVKVNEFKWHLRTNDGYIFNNQVGMMHRFLLTPPKGLQVDHVNGDRTDNRRSNLRICTGSQNKFNSNKHRDNTSGHKGVTWDKAREKWQAQIMIRGKQIYLGRFDSKIKAGERYARMATKLQKEFKYSPSV